MSAGLTANSAAWRQFLSHINFVVEFARGQHEKALELESRLAATYAHREAATNGSNLSSSLLSAVDPRQQGDWEHWKRQLRRKQKQQGHPPADAGSTPIVATVSALRSTVPAGSPVAALRQSRSPAPSASSGVRTPLTMMAMSGVGQATTIGTGRKQHLYSAVGYQGIVPLHTRASTSTPPPASAREAGSSSAFITRSAATHIAVTPPAASLLSVVYADSPPLSPPPSPPRSLSPSPLPPSPSPSSSHPHPPSEPNTLRPLPATPNWAFPITPSRDGCSSATNGADESLNDTNEKSRGPSPHASEALPATGIPIASSQPSPTPSQGYGLWSHPQPHNPTPPRPEWSDMALPLKLPSPLPSPGQRNKRKSGMTSLGVEDDSDVSLSLSEDKKSSSNDDDADSDSSLGSMLI
eukprot:TRINITY_DN11583_c0_g1_i2.p1 TRINITY_DN11583_c0_g1~~TRINITY_DN11583_c0_g1_i2.p1  ORF type:complete len:410 (+),score=31.29 TRINITY_DN11583_c0_g1_i2:150-1379(+)